MDNTDYLYASDGSGEAPRMTITGARSIGATTIPVDSVTNVPDRFIATSGTLDPDTGLLDPSTLLVFKGHVSGSDLEIDEFAPGYVDAANTVGQIVVIKPTTLWADLMADSVKANQKFPAQFSDFVEPDGAVWTQSSGLNGDMTAGYIWFNGSRNAANAIAGQLFTASKDTYVDIDPVTGDPTYVEATNGAVEPAVTTDNVRVAKIVTDASGITDINQVPYVRPIDMNNMGWVSVSDTWAYASYDSTNKTGVITVPTNATFAYSAGMKVRFANNAAIQYGFITKVTATTLTIYFGTDYSLTNSTISSVYYSYQKAPLGFPLDPAKWTVTATLSTNQSQSNPVANTWYNPASFSISFPLGCWNAEWVAVIEGTKVATTSMDVFATLSTANNSESDTDFSTYHYSAGASGTIIPYLTQGRHKFLTLTSATTYYLNIKTTTASAANVIIRGDSVPATIKAVCAYL